MSQQPELTRVNSSPPTPSSPTPMASVRPTPSTRKPVRIPASVPALPASEPQNTLNFHRRPSTTFDPVSTRSRELVSPSMPSTREPSPAWSGMVGTTRGASSNPRTPPRSPTVGGGPAAWPAPRTDPPRRSTPSPSPTSGGPAASSARAAETHHRHRSSHSRNPSISLASPSPTSATFPGQANILPPHPVPTRTRAPIESFASVEMLQGQREFQERRRGSEVWGSETGRYEGRAVSARGGHEAPQYSTRRVDPTEHVRQARGSQRLSSGAPVLPAIDVDVASIASQLREHDRSADVRNNPQRRHYSATTISPTDTGSPSSTAILVPTPNFSFPARPTISVPYTLESASDSSSDEDGSGYDLGADEKSYGGFASTSSEKLGPGSSSAAGAGKKVASSGWKTEALEGDKAAEVYGARHRPSIVALPVYPAPSGTLANSWKFKKNLKKVGVVVSWVTLAGSMFGMWMYLGRRMEGMVEVEAKIPGRFAIGWVFLVIEYVVAAVVCTQAIWDVVSYRSLSSVPKLRLRGDKNLPSVDVFIVSSGQPNQITFDCAIAAASMDYPAHRFRVMVLDPTGSNILERDVNKHAKTQGCPHLTYHRRILNSRVGDIFHTKANSINFGMKEASTFGIKGPGEFVAVFDADVIPERNFLRAALPAVLSNAKVALVKTGHGFMNLPPKLRQATSTLMEAAEPAYDSRSGFILRRTAIQEIGGFPTDSWLQDGLAECLLQGRGYSTVVVDEVLQWGMAKPTYGVQINQMMVNRLGPLRTAIRLGFFLGGEQVRLMTVGARLRALGRAFTPIFSLSILALTIAYPFMFSYGRLMVLTPNLDSLNILLQACLIMLATASLHDLVWTWSTGLPSPRRKFQAWVFTGPYEAVALFRMILPTWLGGYVRGSDIDVNSVLVPARPPFSKRFMWLVLDPHSGVLFVFAGSIGVSIWRAVREHRAGRVDTHQTALTLLLTVAWPSMIWIDILYGSLVPYTSLLFPSHRLTEPRESFVIRDVYSSIARPKHSCKTARPFRVRRAPQFITAFILIGWSIACVVLGDRTQIFA